MGVQDWVRRYVARSIIVLGVLRLRSNAFYAENGSEFEREIAPLLSQPISFSMGPFVDTGGDDVMNIFDPSPLDFLAFTSKLPSDDMEWIPRRGFLDQPRIYHPGDRYKNSFGHLVRHHLVGPLQAKAFDVRQSGSHVQLQLPIPNYKHVMERHQENEGDQPLIVAIVGRSLVIQGQRTSKQAVGSFQRSFELPRTADLGAIHAAYNAADESLSVDIPLKRTGTLRNFPCKRAKTTERLEPLEDGSQTTITIVQGDKAVDEDSQLLSMLMNFFTSRQVEAGSPNPAMRKAMWKNEKRSQMTQKTRCRRKAIAVQPKNAKPFWRLVGSEPHARPAIEVVAPRGIDLGSPNDRQMPIYNGTGGELRSARAPIGKVTLPVQVSDADCAWTAEPLPAWMIGLVGSLAAFAAVLLAVAIGFGTSSLRMSGLHAIRKPCTLFKMTIALLASIMLLGVAFSVYLAHKKSHEFDERSYRCSIGHDSMIKVPIRVAGEL